VEADRAGFSKGQPLNKIGQQAQDTAEIFLNNVRVPATNLLGQEGKGFGYLMEELAWERLMIAIRSVAGAVEAIEQTVAYTKERQAFGQSVIEFQNSRFKLAECKTKTQIARVYADHCLDLVSRGELDPEAAAMAKVPLAGTRYIPGVTEEKTLHEIKTLLERHLVNPVDYMPQSTPAATQGD
jgi:alkylation response protein AidB-like acyl-CoA dehydrogenase